MKRLEWAETRWPARRLHGSRATSSCSCSSASGPRGSRLKDTHLSKPPLTIELTGELNLWLGHALLLFPASLLIGYGFGPPLGGAIRRIVAGGARDEPAAASTWRRHADPFRGRCCATRAFLVLLDLPVTDDEYRWTSAAAFSFRPCHGGRRASPRGTAQSFSLLRNGAVGSFDWVGGQAVAALAHLTGLGPLVWALVAAVPVPVLAILMGRRLGPPWGLAAAALFLSSPMALVFSMTTHAQLASRALIALMLLAFWVADSEGGLRRWVLTGGLLGLAVLCRPFESCSSPRRSSSGSRSRACAACHPRRQRLPGLVLGGAVFAAIFFWHSYAMTGNRCCRHASRTRRIRT